MAELAARSRGLAVIVEMERTAADGATEEEVLQQVFHNARECLRNLIVTGQPLPEARSLDELPQRDQREFRRLLLIIS